MATVFEVALHLVRTELATRHRGSALGWLWALGPPLLQLAATYFLFTRVIPLDVPDYPVFLLVASNRDEERSRPSSPPGLWVGERRRILSPRDRRAGGTWLAVNDRGMLRPQAGQHGGHRLVQLALAHAQELERGASGVTERSQQIEDCRRAELLANRGDVLHRRVHVRGKTEADAQFIEAPLDGRYWRIDIHP